LIWHKASSAAAIRSARAIRSLALTPMLREHATPNSAACSAKLDLTRSPSVKGGAAVDLGAVMANSSPPSYDGTAAKVVGLRWRLDVGDG